MKARPKDDTAQEPAAVRFFELAERFRNATDPDEAKRLGDELGRAVFDDNRTRYAYRLPGFRNRDRGPLAFWFAILIIEMQRLEHRGYIVEYDREATVSVYSSLAQGGATLCLCNSCENFTRLRSQAYPPEFVSLLETLGVDPTKEGEAYECGKDGTGLYIYGGWFHFLGRVVQTGPEADVNGFKYWFDLTGPPAGEEFRGGAASAIEFLTHLPWVSDRPEPL